MLDSTRSRCAPPSLLLLALADAQRRPELRRNHAAGARTGAGAAGAAQCTWPARSAQGRRGHAARPAADRRRRQPAGHRRRPLSLTARLHDDAAHRPDAGGAQPRQARGARGRRAGARRARARDAGRGAAGGAARRHAGLAGGVLRRATRRATGRSRAREPAAAGHARRAHRLRPGAMPAERTMARQEALALADRRDDALRDVAKARARRCGAGSARAPTRRSKASPPSLRCRAEQVRADLHRHAEIAPYDRDAGDGAGRGARGRRRAARRLGLGAGATAAARSTAT